MTIDEILKKKDLNTYKKLKKIGSSKRAIKLGDTTENLMKSDSYTRSGGSIKQRSWK